MAETKNGIKYPDNYDSVADVPQHLKEMAESIDPLIENKVEKEDGKGLSTNDFTNAYKEKLDGLNNYDDTKIKQDIKDIKDEQKTQNEDISTLKAEKEALEKEVQSLKEDAKLNGLTEDNSGELIHIDNSTGSRFNSLEICGNEKQETREGYNLFDVLGLSLQNQDKGVTIDRSDDGYITANGTSTQAGTVYLRDYNLNAKLEDGETYTLWQENYSEETYSGIYLQVIAKPIAGGTDTYIEASTQKKTFKVDKSKYTYQSNIQISTLEAAGVFENYKNRYMIYKGTDDKEFELYGAMPSFDYSSEVKCVGDNINLFDGETELGEFNGGTGDKTNSSTTIRNKNPIYVKGLNKIIFSCNSEPQAINFYEYDKNNSFLKYTKLAKNKYLELDTNTEYVNFSRNNNIDVSKIKLESGEKITDYSKFGQGNLHLKVLNKNFIDISRNASVTKNGMTFTTDNNGVLTINGTATTNIYLKLDNNDLLDNDIPNWKKRILRKGTYVFSVENLSGKTKDINMSAYIRNGVYAEDYALLYHFFKSEKTAKTFTLTEDVNRVIYLWIYAGITLNNAKFKFQLELAQEATDIISNEEQNYIIPVQQRMFSGDKFVKVDGKWKEMHTMGTVYSKDVSVGVSNATSNADDFYRYSVNFGQLGRKAGSYIKILSNYFKYADSRWHKEEGICGWENGQLFCIGTYNKNFDTAEKLKTFLTENNVEIAYELAKPIYLDCTPEQVAVLDKIEQEAHTYSEITNIYTEDEVGAVLKTNTAVDLKSVINNIQEQLIAG